LLNIDYDGRGDFKSHAVNCTKRYGVLMSSDAVWLKRVDSLFNSSQKNTALKVLKYAVFCMHNNAPDVGIDVLLRAKNDHNIEFGLFEDTKLFTHLDYLMHKHFYSMKWQPAQLISSHQKLYRNIFNKKMLETHEYNQSNFMNPN
jgi:hypothetical protein